MADGTSKDERQSIDNAIVPYDKLKSIGSEEEKTFEQLQTYICTYRPLIYINHYDFATIDSMVMKVAEKGFEGGGIVEYVEGYGRVDFATKKDLNKGESLAELLESYVQQDDLEGNWILLLKNVHKELEETKIQSLIRQIAGRSMGEYGRCHTGYLVYVIIVSPIKVIPPLLERLMCVVSLGSPDETEILEYLKSDSGRQGASENDLKEMSSMLRGFSRLEIDKILYTMDQGGMAFNSDEAQKTILQEKRQQVEKSGLLRIAKVNENDITVGGLGFLTKYLEHESKILSDAVRAKEFGVEMPKGILIVGVPGCGKTMLSKFTAYKFRMPLICLEIGNLMGPYVGQSEENLRKALATVEAAAPCVLWIDEIEKAFAGVNAGGDGGSEVTTRLFGSFLTWMQEKKDSVYVVATANRIQSLPPELLRRGRFDEIFWAGLPGPSERTEIFKVHIEKRRKSPGCLDNKDYDFDALAKASAGFCGADIASAVSNAFKAAFINDAPKVTQQILEKAVKELVPLKKTLKQQIEELEAARGKYGFIDASDGKQGGN